MFWKLSKDGERTHSLGLLSKEFTYSPDYFGVRVGSLDRDFDKLSTVTIELPAINPSRQSTALLSVNPELFLYGTVSYPSFIGHDDKRITPTITFKPHTKGEVKVDWLVEYRLI